MTKRWMKSDTISQKFLLLYKSSSKFLLLLYPHWTLCELLMKAFLPSNGFNVKSFSTILIFIIKYLFPLGKLYFP